MVDHAVWPALPEGHVEGIEYEPSAQVVGHGTADHATAEDIEQQLASGLREGHLAEFVDDQRADPGELHRQFAFTVPASDARNFLSFRPASATDPFGQSCIQGAGQPTRTGRRRKACLPQSETSRR